MLREVTTNLFRNNRSGFVPVMVKKRVKHLSEVEIWHTKGTAFRFVYQHLVNFGCSRHMTIKIEAILHKDLSLIRGEPVLLADMVHII